MPGDEMVVAALHVLSWQVAHKGLLPDEYLNGLRPEDRVLRALAEEEGRQGKVPRAGRDLERRDRGEVRPLAVGDRGHAGVESYNGFFKDESRENAGAPGRRRMRGLAASRPRRCACA